MHNMANDLSKNDLSNNALPNNDLLIDNSGGVLKISFNRPEKKNAITYPMYRSLHQELQRAEQDPEVRVVVFTGVGTIYSAGNDIRSFQTGKDIPFREKPSRQFMQTLATFSKPVICALNGDAIGIAATMLFHCDLLYGVSGAQIKMPFLTLGAVPEFASSLLLPQLVGHTKAFEIFTLREKISCEEGMALNWVNGVFPAEELMPFVDQCAEKLAARSSVALQATKKLMKQATWKNVAEIIDDEGDVFGECLKSPETQAIFAAFFNKK